MISDLFSKGYSGPLPLLAYHTLKKRMQMSANVLAKHKQVFRVAKDFMMTGLYKTASGPSTAFRENPEKTRQGSLGRRQNLNAVVGYLQTAFGKELDGCRIGNAFLLEDPGG